MAEAFLAAGATAFAAANWSDTTGFVDDAELVVPDGSATITGDLDQSALTNGIDYFDELPGSNRNIGGAAGTFTVATRASLYSAATQRARVRFWGAGGTNTYSPGATKTCHILQVGLNKTVNVVGSGALRLVQQDGGTLRIAQNITADTGSAAYEWVIVSGTATIDHSGTGVHVVRVLGGSLTLRRGVATHLYIHGGNVTIDARGETIAAITHTGGTLTILNCGTITAYNGLAGVFDASRALRAITITTLTHTAALNASINNKISIGTRVPVGMGSDGLN